MNFRFHSLVSSVLLALALAVPKAAQADTIGFDIVLDYQSSTTAAELAAFEAAEARWESLITGFQDTNVETSLTISVTLEAIDGPFNVLGSAGPTSAKKGDEGNFAYADTGTMRFDTADTARLAASGTLDDVILHEMGHVLGIGTLWNPFQSFGGSFFMGTQSVYNQNSGQYTGINAIAAWQGEFGQTDSFVPVELGGGAGTRNAHWDEVDGGFADTGITSQFGENAGSDFGDELMTGWLGGETFISNVTKGSLIDIGYIVPSFRTAPVPEPGFAGLLLLAGAGLFSQRRRTA